MANRFTFNASFYSIALFTKSEFVLRTILVKSLLLHQKCILNYLDMSSCYSSSVGVVLSRLMISVTFLS